MTKNPLLDELYAIREALLFDAGGTLDGLVDRLQSEEQRSERAKFHPRPASHLCEETISGSQDTKPMSLQTGDP